MVRILDNHMLLYINDFTPSEYYVMGDYGVIHSTKYGEFITHTFNTGKFTELEVRYFVQHGATITKSNFSGIVMTNVAPIIAFK